jgi:hypothetical protein
MTVTNPPIIFSYEMWVGLFPEFASVSSTQGSAYFLRATNTFAANSCTNPAFGDGRLEYLLYLATSHVAYLSCPKDANGNPAATGTEGSQLVGRISSASEGSVSVATEYQVGGDMDQLSAYLDQSKYGAEYYAAISNYRTAVYLANPTRVVNGFGSLYGGYGRRPYGY